MRLKVWAAVIGVYLCIALYVSFIVGRQDTRSGCSFLSCFSNGAFVLSFIIMMGACLFVLLLGLGILGKITSSDDEDEIIVKVNGKKYVKAEDD